MPILLTESNTRKTERLVRQAAREASIVRRVRDLRTFFEHGQWWVEDADTGAQWSVVDSEPGFGVGFDFEQVTVGQTE